MGLRRIAVAAVLVLGLAVPAGAQAATFNVNTTADTSVAGGCTGDPACSLRDAISAATASADPANRIEVPAGTYAISAGELVVNNGSVTIHGAGARSTVIDAKGSSRVLSLEAPEVAIEGVTITGGSADGSVGESLMGDGGGIVVQSTEKLVLNQVAVVGNTAMLNGGGIAAPPESLTSTAITIANSTIAANKVSGGPAEGMGGGVYTLGDITIVNSTITANSAENLGLNTGGGVLAGIDLSVTGAATTATVLNSTIAGNSLAAGGAGAGFAIYNPTAGSVTAFAVKNTIIAGNTAGATAADCGMVVAVTSANNISGDGSCMFTDPGSRQNTNPQLGGLADNGGPTNTMALPASSPAVNAGTNAGCPPTDQRGVARPQGSACDIGAYELIATAPVAVPGKASADLKLRIKAKPKRFQPAGKLTFLITVANRGPDAATGVLVKGTVPASTKRIAGKKVAGKKPCKLRKAKKGKRQFTCKLGRLAVGKKGKLKAIVKPAPGAGKLRARARVRSGVADPSLKDNKAKAVAKPSKG